MAVPNPATSDPLIAEGQMSTFDFAWSAKSSRPALRITSAPTLSPVVRFCTVALFRVPRMLITAVTRITITASTREAPALIGTICEKYPENATASVASEPLAITKKVVQP